MKSRIILQEQLFWSGCTRMISLGVDGVHIKGSIRCIHTHLIALPASKSIC